MDGSTYDVHLCYINNMKIKWFIFILSSLLLLIAITSALNLKSYQSNSLPKELYNQFRCDRISKETLSTDKYCNDYNLYKKDHAAGRI